MSGAAFLGAIADAVRGTGDEEVLVDLAGMVRELPPAGRVLPRLGIGWSGTTVGTTTDVQGALVAASRPIVGGEAGRGASDRCFRAFGDVAAWMHRGDGGTLVALFARLEAGTPTPTMTEFAAMDGDEWIGPGHRVLREDAGDPEIATMRGIVADVTTVERDDPIGWVGLQVATPDGEPAGFWFGVPQGRGRADLAARVIDHVVGALAPRTVATRKAFGDPRLLSSHVGGPYVGTVKAPPCGSAVMGAVARSRAGARIAAHLRATGARAALVAEATRAWCAGGR